MGRARAANLRHGRRLSRPRRTLLEGCFFLLLAIASTWPLARHGLDHLPLGTEPAATVPLFNVWTVWWNSDRAAAGYQGYWDAPIFYPTDGSFAYSEPQPLSVAAAPIIWLTGNRIAAYNFLVIIFIWLNGWIACRLLRQLCLHRLAAWSGGAIVALLPLVHSWLGVLQLIPVFGILLAVQALYRFGRRPEIARGVLLGASLALTFLLCSYYGLFLLASLAITGLWLVVPLLGRARTWVSLAAGGLVCLVCCLPVILAHYQTLGTAGLVHDPRYLAELSARPADYLSPVWPTLLGANGAGSTVTSHGFRLNPGYFKTGLALAGLCWALLSRRRRWAMVCLSIGVVAFLLSLGPTLQIAGHRPYLLLVDWLPGFGQARNVFRFAILVHVMIALLAVLGLQAGLVAARKLSTAPAVRKALAALIAAAGVAAVVEQPPPAQPLYRPPDAAAHRAWTKYVAGLPPENGAIVCLPFAFKPDTASYEQEALWMYWQTYHRRPMLNGYSGYFPPHFVNLKWPMAEFPAKASVDLLLQLDITEVVVRRDSPQGAYINHVYRQHPRIARVFQDNRAAVDIYRIRTHPPRFPAGAAP